MLTWDCRGWQLDDSAKAAAEAIGKYEAALARQLASKNSELVELREQHILELAQVSQDHQAQLHDHQQSKDEEIAALEGNEICRSCAEETDKSAP